MNWHPFAERFPFLEGEEKAALDASIASTKGCAEQPIMYRLHKGKRQGLDGRNRERSCIEQGFPPKYTLVRVPDGEVKEFILRRNVHRRHMTKELRQSIVAELREDGKSTRQIAESMGVHQSTIVRDLSGDAIASPENVTGSDGKTYSAKKPPSKRTRRKPKFKPTMEFCERCTRLGPVEGCQQCQNVGKPENGKIAFDWLELEDVLRDLALAPENIKTAYPSKAGTFFAGAHRQIDTLIKHFHAWQKALTGGTRGAMGHI